jgi:predicted transposase/invertase (TIGR01784 family)
MQMFWTGSFKKRMLFNAGKAYIRQLKKGGKYSDLKPVYGLSLVDDIFHTGKAMKNIYYHHYKIVHSQFSNVQIKGLELIFVELPKFKAQSFTDRRLMTLWLRFLTEINEQTDEVSKELLEVDVIREALEHVQIEAFTEEELLYYDQYWDSIRIEKAAVEDLKKRNRELQKQKAEAEKQKVEALEQKAEAEKQKAEALDQKAKAEKQKAEALDQKAEAEKQKAEALDQKAEAEKQKAEALEQKAEALEQKAEAEKQKTEAKEQEESQRKEKQEALNKIIFAVKTMIKQGFDRVVIASAFKLSIQEIERMMEIE